MRELIASFHEAGLRTVMITGDQPATACAVANELGLNGAGALDVVDAEALARMQPEELQIARRTPVFARVSPSHKLEIVRAERRSGDRDDRRRHQRRTGAEGRGHRDRDGHGGTNLARQTASVVLEDDELSTMLEAVRRGRTIHGNIRRSIHFILATNLSEIMVVLAATARRARPAVAAVAAALDQSDQRCFPCLALAVEPPEPDVLRRPPRDPHEAIIPAAQLPESPARRRSSVRAHWRRTATGFALRPGAACGHARVHVAGCRPAAARLDLPLGARTACLPRKRCRPAISMPRCSARWDFQAAALLIPGLRGLLGLGRLSLMDGLVAEQGGIVPFAINELRSCSGGRRRAEVSARAVTAGRSVGVSPRR